MRFGFRFAVFVAVSVLMAWAPLEAKLKKVPVNETTVIKPSAIPHKKIEAKKFDKKKVRLKKDKKKGSDEDVLEMDNHTDAQLAATVTKVENLKVVVPKQRRVDTEVSVNGEPLKVENQQVAEQVVVKTDAKVEKVDRLSESSPNQVEVTKEKKKRKWQFWKRKKK